MSMVPWVSETQARASHHLDDPTQRVLPEQECERRPLECRL